MPEIACGGFTASGEKTDDKTAAEAVQKACDGQNARVKSVEKQTKARCIRKLYDLTTLQTEKRTACMDTRRTDP